MVQVKEEVEERELTQLCGLLGGGGAELDTPTRDLDTPTLDLDTPSLGQEEDPDLMAFMEDEPPLYRYLKLTLVLIF
jgi:hypothetical protein